MVYLLIPEIGDDYNNYLKIIVNPSLAVEFGFEPFSVILIYIINQFSLSVDWFFGFHGLVVGYFVSKSVGVIKTQTVFRNDNGVVFVLMAVFFIGAGISVVRQSAAASIILYAVLTCLMLRYPYRIKIFSYLIFTVLATCFHYSALVVSLVMLVIYFVSRTGFSWLFAFVLLFLFTLVFANLAAITEWIEFYVPIYASHLGNRALAHEVSNVFFFTFTGYVLLFVSALYLRSLPQASKGGLIVLNFFLLTLSFGLGLKLLSLDVLVFNRLVFYPSPFYIIFVALLVYRVQQRIVLLAGIGSVMLALMITVFFKRLN